MKALIITRHYLDENLGGPNCSKAIVKAVCALMPDTTLIYPEHDGRDTDLSFLAPLSPRLLPCHDHRPRCVKMLDMYRGVLHRFPSTVKRHLQGQRYDIAFIDHSFTASSGVIQRVRRAAATVVTIHHNVERDYLRDNREPAIYRLPYVAFALKAERDAIAASDLNLTLTRADADRLAQAYPARSATIQPLGVFEYQPAAGTCGISSATGHSFVISGSLQAQQTETALMDFMAHYMPALLSACPDATLTVAGRNPSARLRRACAAYPQVTVVPNPEDLQAEVSRHNYYIAPINTGSGLKLRVMDPLRAGLPVIAHEVSARGYEAMAEAGFMVSYHDTASFATALRSLLAMEATHQSVAHCYHQHFSTQAGIGRLGEILQMRNIMTS